MIKFLSAVKRSEYFYYYLVGLLFVLINSLFIVKNFYVFYTISFLIIIFIAAFKKLEYIYFSIIALTPLSISLSDFINKGSFDISLFTEPLLILILFLLLFKLFNSKNFSIPKSLHVVSLVFIVQVLWMLFASYNSTIQIVSLKMFLARLWFLIPVYFLGLEYFKDFKKIKLFLWLHGGTLIIIVIYATIRLIGTGFSSANASHLVVKPFYNDHTAYGAIVTFLAPVFILFSFTNNLKKWQKIFSIIISIFLITAIVLSYSRAAWIAFAVSIIAFICIKFKIRFVYLVSVFMIFVLTFWFFRFQIIDSLSKNSQDSSNDLSKHLESVTNISTDASNVERINRWYCAIEMFQNRPFFGWGPGTYQFQYAIFQVMRMRTVISTNDGDWGNAHSEYITAMTEQGIVGLIIMLILTYTILSTGFKVSYKAKDKNIRLLAIGITLGFVTYFVHGFLNNFLDTDKLAIPFFGLAAILVALDKYHMNSNFDLNQSEKVLEEESNSSI